MTAAQHSTLFLLLKSARPRQWIKNIALFASLVFSGFFFAVVDGQIYLLKVSYATGVFCLLTSAIYIFNDLNDREVDRLHPFKSKRPIASGALDSQIALAVAVVALVTSLFLALWLSPFFFLVIAAYVGLQVLYSRVTKHIPILDVLSIATGFLLRVYAGAVVVNLHMSVWFLLTVVSASLFFAVGKRQSERTLLKGQEMFGETRKTLKRYSERLLDLYTGMFANSTWLTYAL
jgi:4-hydroxybenzoate polyprenyltransferase